MNRFLIRFAFIAVFLITPAASAAPPNGAGERTEAIGQPVAIEAFPTSVTLAGPRAARQVVVTGKYSDGTVRDLTHFAMARVEKAGIADLQDGLFLRGIKDGSAAIVIAAGGKEVRVLVTVTGMDQPSPISFRRDVIAAMNVGGCNMGACHGTPSGKNGFKLSLRGFDPAADYLQLTREQFGRRTDAHNPAASLMLLKAIGRAPHEGGQRFGANSLPAEMMTSWLKEGKSDDDANLPPVRKIEVAPGSRVLKTPGKWQQLAVVATFADGSTRDVTRLTNFSSSDPATGEVGATGLVEFKRPGEVAILCRYLEEMVAVRLTYLEPREGFAWTNPPEANFIDKHVNHKLRMMSILPSGLCNDAEFVRRAYLDAVGRMPTPEEARGFLADTDPNKRAALIDPLVDLPEFADFWALKWADVLRSSRKSMQMKGSFGVSLWLRDEFRKPKVPVDQLVRDLLTASGNTFTNPPANFFRVAKDPQALAETTAQLFLGVRMQCAKCHNHPFERWSQDDYYSTAAWFAQVKVRPQNPALVKARVNAGADIVSLAREGEVKQPRTGKTMKPRYPGGVDAELKPGEDRRAVLAKWLTSPENPFFAKSVVNRVWFHVTGKGIVDPVDDFRESNPSCNDELLDALAKDFAANGFDLKRLVKTIMKSRTYQASAEPNDSNRDDSKYFSHATTRLLTAEQLLDAICDFTAVPEKFTGLPLGTRAVQLPDSDVNHAFLKAFGQPARELACECERESDGNLGQALQLINGPTVNEKVRSPGNRLARLIEAKTPEKDILIDLYYASLSRPPSEDEQKVALAHIAKNSDKRKAWEDLLWALLNTREFVFRH